jgi:adenylate kinase family enzyme
MKECDDIGASEMGFQALVEKKSTDGDCSINVPTLEYGRHPDWEECRSDQRASYNKHGILKEERRRDRLELDIRWELRFQQLVVYKKTKGDCNVPSRYASNRELGRWVCEQRFMKGKNKLRKDRVDKLLSIGLVWDTRQVGWDSRFQDLIEFKQTYGHCDVPRRYALNRALGRWVCEQRTMKGKDDSLRKYRTARLESIGFDSSGQARIRRDDWWDSFFEELREYLRNNGDCNVPEEYRLNPSLSEWIRKQRHHYSLKCDGDGSAMTAEHEAKLNVLGFSWVKSQPSAASNDTNNAL